MKKKLRFKHSIEKERAVEKYNEGKENVFTLREVSNVTGINKNKLMYQVNRGKLPAKKLGWIWVIERSQVEELVAQNKEAAQ